jgi:lipopolysaccharide transport system ATP-binding protein
MYLRLAFAVAAHLEPEVLIVDEVLAVGDVEFQKKCLGKMERVSGSEGRTVLFVSHNMNAIQRLCSRCIFLRGGRLVEYGPTQAVVSRYLAETTNLSSPGEWIDLSGVPRAGTGEARFRAVRYSSDEPDTAFQPYPFAPLEFVLRIHAESAMVVGSLAITFFDRGGTKLVNLDSRSIGRSVPLIAGENNVRLKIEALYLNPGVYTVGLWLAQARGTPLDHAESALEVEVVEHERNRLGERPPGDGVVPGRFELVVTGRAP